MDFTMKRFLADISREEAASMVTSLLYAEPDNMSCIYEGRFHSIYRSLDDRVAIVYLTNDESYGVCLFGQGEFDRKTFVCRDVTNEEMYRICANYSFATRPCKAFSIEEALEESNARCIHTFLGDESEMVWIILDLIRKTGHKVSDAEDLLYLLSHEVKEDILRGNEDVIRRVFTQHMQARFLKYALYEFLRTEDYGHLQSILASSGRFGLSEGWERHCMLLEGLSQLGQAESTAEMYVIGCYLYKNTKFTYAKSHKDISSFTGIPVALIEKAYKINDTWRCRAVHNDSIAKIAQLLR